MVVRVKRIVYIALIVGLSLAAFASIFAVWATGVFPQVTKIADSQRFTGELENGNVSAWISGHIHSLHSQENVRIDQDGVAFIGNGSIIGEPESLFLIFENGKRKVTVKSRNHSKREWNENLDNKFSFNLKQEFQYRKEDLIVWSFCDIQPNNEKDWELFENTIRDVNSLDIELDMAFVLGDLVDDGAENDLKRFKSYCGNTEIPWENFYSLVGNHDFNPFFTGDLNNYKEHIREELNYKVKRGNINFIFLSDTGTGVTGHIGDNVFEWWREIVSEEDESNSITLTHQPLEGTTRNSVTEIGWLARSERFLVIVLPNIVLILMGLLVAIETSF